MFKIRPEFNFQQAFVSFFLAEGGGGGGIFYGPPPLGTYSNGSNTWMPSLNLGRVRYLDKSTTQFYQGRHTTAAGLVGFV